MDSGIFDWIYYVCNQSTVKLMTVVFLWFLKLSIFRTLFFLFPGGVDKESWCLNSDGTVRHANVELYHLSAAPRDSPTADLLVSTGSPDHTENEKRDDNPTTATMPVEGDTIGVAYDHVELNFYLNGKNMEIPVTNVKGTVYPALYGK